jgi:hypothetical protein
MSTLIDPFADGALPVELSVAGERNIGKFAADKMQALILANLSALAAHVFVNLAAVPVLDTSIYASGDTLFDSTAVANAVRTAGGTAILRSLTLIDKDDNTAAGIDLFFLGANVAFGTLNAAPNISDANGLNILGFVSIASGDFIDVGGSKVATKTGLNMILKAASGTTIYVAAITRGTPTQTASGIQVLLGLEQQ